MSLNIRKPHILWIIASQGVALVSFGIWGVIAFLSPMLSDGGVNATVIAMITFAFSMPVLIVIASLVLWFAYFRQKRTLLNLALIFIHSSWWPPLIVL